jgi:hypothetical protein
VPVCPHASYPKLLKSTAASYMPCNGMPFPRTVIHKPFDSRAIRESTKGDIHSRALYKYKLYTVSITRSNLPAFYGTRRFSDVQTEPAIGLYPMAHE